MTKEEYLKRVTTGWLLKLQYTLKKYNGELPKNFFGLIPMDMINDKDHLHLKLEDVEAELHDRETLFKRAA